MKVYTLTVKERGRDEPNLIELQTYKSKNVFDGKEELIDFLEIIDL